MKFIQTLLLTAGSILLSHGAAAAEPLKVLSLGNSFSLSVRRDLPFMAKAEGRPLKIGILFIGGCDLKNHWLNVEKAKKDPKYRPYDFWFDDVTPEKIITSRTRESFNRVLKREKWDVVILQQASHRSWDVTSYDPYLGDLIALIRKEAPQAKIMLQQTWSYRSDAPRLKNAWPFDQTGMYEKLRDAYAAMAKKYRIEMIPTGLAVQKCRAQSPAYVPPAPGELKKLRWPDLPHGDGADVVGRYFWRERKNGNDLCLVGDCIHLNVRGQYLQSLVWFGTLFHADPAAVKYFNGMVSVTDTEFLKKCAAEAVQEMRMKE